MPIIVARRCSSEEDFHGRQKWTGNIVPLLSVSVSVCRMSGHMIWLVLTADSLITAWTAGVRPAHETQMLICVCVWIHTQSALKTAQNKRHGWLDRLSIILDLNRTDVNAEMSRTAELFITTASPRVHRTYSNSYECSHLMRNDLIGTVILCFVFPLVSFYND